MSCFTCTLTFHVESAHSAFGYQRLTLVIKVKTRITNMLQPKTTQKLVVIFTTSLFLMILLLSPSYTMMLPKVPYTELSPTDNPLEENQPTNMPTTSTGCYPIKNSPASTNISDKV
uniref:Female-specific orf protein n=1 Tax=Cambarunio iris TaxID=96919 RepID=F4ZFV7_9BIVA|nr:female-specific orf protein [Cambarunio iris]AEC14191.1 female-specific orf protein [Cambarunio iris]AEC14192.1 female-specific orf protein [Cambarunio iris]